LAGNTTDVTTVEHVVTTMKERYGKSDRIWVMDRGMVSERNLLTEAEAAFRIHKSDLSLRPIWHQKEDRVGAQIQVCFLSYVLWKTLGQLCQHGDLGDEPRRVLRELSELRALAVILPTDDGIEIRKRCIGKPTDHQQILLHHLVPCQGLDLGCVIAKRPPLSDFALRPTPNFRVDGAPGLKLPTHINQIEM